MKVNQLIDKADKLSKLFTFLSEILKNTVNSYRSLYNKGLIQSATDAPEEEQEEG